MFEFSRLPSYSYGLAIGSLAFNPAGFPHSDIHGSILACSSPWLFAAYRVLLRLLAPRHPPNALISLTFFPFFSSYLIKMRLGWTNTLLIVCSFVYLALRWAFINGFLLCCFVLLLFDMLLFWTVCLVSRSELFSYGFFLGIIFLCILDYLVCFYLLDNGFRCDFSI